MQNTKIAAALACLVAVPGAALAQDSPHAFTGNVGIYSQYIFRGLTQTNEDPALQGGFDYAHSSGIYLGVWGSNISWLQDAGSYTGGGSLELDIYGGYKKGFGDFTADVGLLQYWYPGDLAPGAIKADTLEAYGAVGWKWFTLKYSNVISNKAFGVKDARGTEYWDLSATLPVGDTGVTLGAHYGIQKFRGSDDRNVGGASNDEIFSYDDWRVSAAYDLGKVSKTLGGAEVGVMYTDTSGANNCGYGSTSDPCSLGGSGFYPKNIANDQVTVWFKKTF